MIRKEHLKFRLLVIIGLTILGIFLIFPLNKKINLGLDLKGGMYVLLKGDTTGLESNKIRNATEAAIEKIRTRIDDFGVKETSISLVGDNLILVQIPGIINTEIVNKLKEVGKLEFKLVEEDKEKINKAIDGEVPEGYELLEFHGDKFLLYKEPSLVGSDLAESFIGLDSIGMPSVKIQFTKEGTKKFAKVTEENVGKRLAIVLDGKIKSAPLIKEAILSGQAEITGEFTMDDARLLSSILNSGALPIPLSVEEERSVGPLLGSDSIKRGLNSIILGIFLVVVFMLFYYFFGGIVAFICLVLDLIFILMGLKILNATLTLPGIAGIILTLGMAVDANVLIYERIREELKSKKPLLVAIKNGFDYSKSAIYDSNITTIIAAVFLFYFGTGPIRGFATTLILGNIVSIFTAIWVGKTILSLFLNMGLAKFPMLEFFKSKNIDFISLRVFCFILSIVLIIFGMFNFYSKQEYIYGVDFKGGQVLEYKINPAVEIEKIRNILKNNGITKVEIQDFKDVEGGVIIKSRESIEEKADKILKENFEVVEKLKVTTIGPSVGKILKEKATLAVIFSILGILFYVGFRFKHFDFGLAGVIALLHDALIALGFVSIFNYEVNMLTITALLTIIGYSINDTIVIYDRVRELSKKFSKLSLKDLINNAVNSTLSRTVITSFTTIMVVVAMYFLGGEALKGFSFCLLVGFISGVYSTIFIACPLVLLFRKKSTL